MLDIKNLSVVYASKESSARPAVEQFSLSVGKGKIVSLVGESGSGKTTVIRSVIGALPSGASITSGDILLHGISVLGYSRSRWRKIRGTNLSMIFQDSGNMLNPIRTVGSQFMQYIRIHSEDSRSEAWNRAVSMLRSMRLPAPENVMGSYPFELSGGMRQRVGIAMAMTFRPDLLLADEPTSALDVTSQAQIVRQMMELRERYGTTILMVTHNIGVAAYMSDHMVVMKDGRMLDRGDRKDILSRAGSSYTKDLLDAVPEIGGSRFV
jgi:peptide/nickel transport system ATP-binding protein